MSLADSLLVTTTVGPPCEACVNSTLKPRTRDGRGGSHHVEFRLRFCSTEWEAHGTGVEPDFELSVRFSHENIASIQRTDLSVSGLVQSLEGAEENRIGRSSALSLPV